MNERGEYLKVEANGRFDVYVIFPPWWKDPTEEEVEGITKRIMAILNSDDIDEWITEERVEYKLDEEFFGEEFYVFCR